MNFNALVKFKWQNAIDRSSLKYKECEEIRLEFFEIKIAPWLAVKPTSNQEQSTNEGLYIKEAESNAGTDIISANTLPFALVPKSRKFNPFLSPEIDLQILKLPNHFLLLNKFAIHKFHFLLTSILFENQFGSLNEEDFKACKELMEMIQDETSRLEVTAEERFESHQKPICASHEILYFYNCGPLSGASINHKHIQVLTNANIPFQPMLSLLNQETCLISCLPYVHACALISLATDTPQALREQLKRLIKISFRRIQRDPEQLFSINPISECVPLAHHTSFNLVFTSTWMMVIPRQFEKFTSKDGNEVSVNSLGFAGFLLAKSCEQAEWIAMMDPLTILTKVSFELLSCEQVEL